MIQAMDAYLDRISAWLLDKLADDGFAKLTASQLEFLGALDCGTNHASNLARVLGISRQAVHKTVRELERAGWLSTDTDAKVGNQRIILFTAEGERMMSAARKHFFDLDKALLREFDKESLQRVIRLLQFDPRSFERGM